MLHRPLVAPVAGRDSRDHTRQDARAVRDPEGTALDPRVRGPLRRAGRPASAVGSGAPRRPHPSGRPCLSARDARRRTPSTAVRRPASERPGGHYVHERRCPARIDGADREQAQVANGVEEARARARGRRPRPPLRGEADLWGSSPATQVRRSSSPPPPTAVGEAAGSERPCSRVVSSGTHPGS
jgi:hypothetical protein